MPRPTHILWAERFDRNVEDLFALQNEITSRIAIKLNFELIDAEVARPIEHPDALDYILRGRAAYAKPRTRDNWAEVIALFERALALDPGSVDAQSRLAAALSARVGGPTSDDLLRAEGLIGQALAASPATHSRISPKVSYCGPSTETRRRYPNTRS